MPEFLCIKNAEIFVLNFCFESGWHLKQKFQNWNSNFELFVLNATHLDKTMQKG